MLTCYLENLGLAFHKCFQCPGNSHKGIYCQNQGCPCYSLALIMILLSRDASQQYIYKLNAKLLSESLGGRRKLWSRLSTPGKGMNVAVSTIEGMFLSSLSYRESLPRKDKQ